MGALGVLDYPSGTPLAEGTLLNKASDTLHLPLPCRRSPLGEGGPSVQPRHLIIGSLFSQQLEGTRKPQYQKHLDELCKCSECWCVWGEV